MEFFSCKDESAWVKTINQWLSEQSQKFAVKRVFVPAGETPRPLYRSWESAGLPFSKTATLVQLDEILTGKNKDQFKNFFISCLPTYQSQFEYIDQAQQSADLAILGLGTNGHVAFHEPGIDNHFFSGCLELNADSAKKLNLEAGTKVVSYGVEAFLQAKGIVLIVRGLSKQNILKQVLAKGSQLPAAALLSHKNLVIVTDFDLDH